MIIAVVLLMSCLCMLKLFSLDNRALKSLAFYFKGRDVC